MKDHPHARSYYALVFLSAALANGAVLSDNFVPLVFFWEGLLMTLYGLIAIGGGQPTRRPSRPSSSWDHATLCLMLGIGILTGHLAGTLTISKIALQPGRAGGRGFRPDA